MADVNRGNRPLSPHLTIYRPQMTAISSIFVRITGNALLVGALLVVWWLLAAATSADYFATADAVITSRKPCVIVVNKWDAIEKDTHTINDYVKEDDTDIDYVLRKRIPMDYDEANPDHGGFGGGSGHDCFRFVLRSVKFLRGHRLVTIGGLQRDLLFFQGDTKAGAALTRERGILFIDDKGMWTS